MTNSSDNAKNVDRVLFVGDGGDEIKLTKAVNESYPNVIIDFNVTRLSLAMGALSRHIRYIRMALFAVKNGKDYAKIFFWQQYAGLYYFILTGMIFLKKRPYIVYYIISKKPRDLGRRLLTLALSRMIEDPCNQKTFFMSSSDYLFTRLSMGSFREKLEVLTKIEASYPYIDQNWSPDRHGETIFCGGSANRKYVDVAEIATALPNERFVIASREEDVAGIQFPANVETHFDAYGDAFSQLILASKLVLLPLADPNVMSGQMVCIRALAAGRPVLLSENKGLRDWIPDIDQLDFIGLYRSSSECATRISAFNSDDLLAAGVRARIFYESRLTDTGFYERLATEITKPVE